MLSKAQIRRRLKKVIAILYRIPLKNRDFSIISNNCWGGVTYDKYALPYLTPTIGLWIPPTDYIRFLKNPDYYLGCELVQISYQESHVSTLLKERRESGRYKFDLSDLVIGRLDDVDIVFIHYRTFQDAKGKWDRRKRRINWEDLIIKFNDQNECTLEDYKEFCKLPYRNKLFFTAKRDWCTEPYCIYVQKYEKDGYVVNDTTYRDVPMNVTKYLNSIIVKENKK